MKYFYTCPLAAAWMSKYFGICFTKWQWNDLSFQFLPVGRDIDPDSSKLYIHPDSVSLLEPQVGDEGIDEDGRQAYYGLVTVDKRNGVPFMWPESEER